jgi:hypothetical protein
MAAQAEQTLKQDPFENEIASCSLKPLHQIAGPGVEDAMSGFDQGMTNSL